MQLSYLKPVTDSDNSRVQCSTFFPALTAVADVDGTETELSGKLGGTFNVSQNFGVYGEVSTITNGDEDRNYGTKLGAKFKF